MSATAGLARRMASWTLSAAAVRGSASHAVASRSPATKALMPSQTYHGRTSIVDAPGILFVVLLGVSACFSCTGCLAAIIVVRTVSKEPASDLPPPASSPESIEQVGLGGGLVRVNAQRLLEVLEGLRQLALL